MVALVELNEAQCESTCNNLPGLHFPLIAGQVKCEPNLRSNLDCLERNGILSEYEGAFAKKHVGNRLSQH